MSTLNYTLFNLVYSTVTPAFFRGNNFQEEMRVKISVKKKRTPKEKKPDDIRHRKQKNRKKFISLKKKKSTKVYEKKLKFE